MKRSAIKRKLPGGKVIKPSFPCAFPKPKDVYRETPAVIYYPDGREVCNTKTVAGNKEYKGRVAKMLERTKGMCCLFGYAPMCAGWLALIEATFEHEGGRGGGKRDDRIELPDGRWQNGVAHLICNQWKGSRHIAYNDAHNKQIEAL
jgi:hypothetical protein